MKRLILTLVVTAATLLGVSTLAPAGIAGAYPFGAQSSISTNAPTVTQGGTFTATVGSCLPNETVVIIAQGADVTVVCDPTTLQASSGFTAPMRPGVYQVCGELSGTGATVPQGVTRPRTVCTSIEVLATGPNVPPTVPGGGLPATGSNGLGTTTTSAIVLVGAGVLLLVVAQVRRRRATHTTA